MHIYYSLHNSYVLIIFNAAFLCSFTNNGRFTNNPFGSILLTVYMSIESEFPRSAAQLRKAVVRGPDALAVRVLHGRGRERGRETGMWRAAVGKGGGRTPLPLALPLDTNSQGCPKRCRSDLTVRSNSRRKPSRKGNINFRFCSRPHDRSFRRPRGHVIFFSPNFRREKRLRSLIIFQVRSRFLVCASVYFSCTRSFRPR